MRERDIRNLKIVKALQNRDVDEELLPAFKLEFKRIEEEIRERPRGLEYLTPHDIDHCLRVTQRIDQLLPEALISSLNNSEILVLLYSILYHDIGMWMNKERLQREFEFQEFVKEKSRELSGELYNKIMTYLNDLNSLEDNERYFVRYILDFFIGVYKRSLHPELSAETILEEAKGKVNIPQGIAEAASNIIKSHGWTKEEVLNSPKLARARVSLKRISTTEEHVNRRLLSVLLRLGDLLDVGRNRVYTGKPDFFDDLPLEFKSHWIKEEKIALTRCEYVHNHNNNSIIIKIKDDFDYLESGDEIGIRAQELAAKQCEEIYEELNNLKEILSNPIKYEIKIDEKIPEIFKTLEILFDTNLIPIIDLTPDELKQFRFLYGEKLLKLKLAISSLNRCEDPAKIEKELRKIEPNLKFFSDLYQYRYYQVKINSKIKEVFREYLSIYDRFQNYAIIFPYAQNIKSILGLGEGGEDA